MSWLFFIILNNHQSYEPVLVGGLINIYTVLTINNMGIEVDRTGKWWNDWWYYYPMYWIFFTHLIGTSLLTNLWKIPCSIFWRWLVDWLLCCDLDELIYWALLRLGNRVQPTSISWDGIGVFLESGLRWGVELWKVWFYKVLHHYAWVGVVMRWSCSPSSSLLYF